MSARPFLFATLTIVLAACSNKDDTSDQTLTLGEASQAVDESSADGQASSLSASTIEISTSFTLGQAATKAADEIRGFIAAELPCADLSLADATLTVKYGARPGNCTYHGHTFTGTHTIKVVRSDDQVEIDHTWTDVSNGRIKLTGTAEVTWSKADLTRHVKHDFSWTRLANGHTGQGTGDRVQSPLGGDWTTGIKVDGSRSWTGPRGQWDLAIQGVEWRWVDPVPQAGSYTLGTPAGKSLSLTYSRVDSDTIKCTVTGGKRTFSFNVDSVGEVGGGREM
jgi:hypothetical protein